MTEKAGKRIIKEILIFVICGVLAVLIETLVFNRNANAGKKVEFCISENSEIPEEIENVERKNAGIRIVFKEPTYIGKMKLCLNTGERTEYTLFTKRENAFGAETLDVAEDVYWPELEYGYTSIQKKITALSLAVSASNASIQEIWLYNKVQYNKDRMLITFLALLLLAFFVKKWNYLIKKVEYLVFLGGILGVCFLYTGGIQENGWDEQIHFMTTYQLSFRGNASETNDAVVRMQERIPKDMYNTLEEKQLFIQYMNNAYNQNKEMTEKTVGWNYRQTGYINQAAALCIGRHLNLSFYQLFLLGKAINLLTYLVLMFLAIKITPVYKNVLLLLAMIPTQIFIASTYTYDVIVHAGLMFGFACWAKIVFGEKQKRSSILIAVSIFVLLLASLSKAVYVPLVLLCCLIPKEKFSSERQFRLFWGIVLLGCAVVVMTFSVPLIRYTINGQTGIMTDSRGGDTDAVLQLQSILRHPAVYVKMLITSIIEALSDFSVGHAALANFGRLGELGSEFLLVTVLWILDCFSGIKGTFVCRITKKMRVFLWAISLSIIVLVWTSMYLIYTPVRTDHMNGVQARYYFPILAPVSFALLGGRNVEFSEKTLKFSLLPPVVLSLAALYQLFIYL